MELGNRNELKSKASKQDNDVAIISNVIASVETLINGSKKENSTMQEPLVSNRSSAMDPNKGSPLSPQLVEPRACYFVSKIRTAR